MYKLIISLALTLFMIVQLSPSGSCFTPYNPDGKGILYFHDSPYKSKINFINKSQLKSLWFYDLTLTAEQATIYVNQLGLSVEAHNQLSKTTDAMTMSKNSIEKIWVYVQYLPFDQPPVNCAADLLSSSIPRFDATHFRTLPQGELSSQRNMFLVEFRKVNIVVHPGEKVILSFFGDFNASVPSHTKIVGRNLAPLWSYSGKDMNFNELANPSEYIVN